MDVHEELATIGARLKEARLQAGVTQEEAAAATGVTRATISNWESGRNGPCLIQFRTMISLYGVTGHQTLFGHHPLELTAAEAKELMAAAKDFTPGLRAKSEMLLMIVGAKWTV